MRLNLEWVDAFVDFADQLNFTHAARLRHVSQPALHAQIRKLQDEVGAPLYHRRGRNLELSAAGRRVAAFGRELRSRERALLAELHGQDDAPVVLQAGEGAYLYLLAPGIRRFTRGRANALALRVGDAPATLAAVREGRADVGVLPLSSSDKGDDALASGALEAELVAEVGQMLVLPRDHPLAERAAVELEDLAGLSLIVPPRDRPLRRALASALDERGVDWSVAVEASGWALILQLAALGVGAAVVNDFCRLPRGLVGVPVRDLPSLRYVALRRARQPVSSASARLWQLLTGV
ncbi:LysR family transcriptional regulator [Pseudenhygromyxa sp. WMMC2535]|uniref:LysR family transcriptional regulator n=1 Tax=Pseudenhygromyxa sp. WMMC2535 TaxID=2712867 RepID=UPI001554B14A|nr:LysR family transcriptional regulator [Pseudenhygromyxa sp. WMMC2535]NVB39293.1 LysR family transcriptional regulator [Pseudenhygromyxa sp. WMMC2535]